jgi:hypothetical protein
MPHSARRSDAAVGAADADLERPDDDPALSALVRDLGDASRPRAARLRDERERHARSTAPSEAEATWAR